MKEKSAPFTKTVKSAVPNPGPTVRTEGSGLRQHSCVENRKSVRFANQASNSEIPGRFSVEVRHEAWDRNVFGLDCGYCDGRRSAVGAPWNGCRLREGQRGHAEGDRDGMVLGQSALRPSIRRNGRKGRSDPLGRRTWQSAQFVRSRL